MSIFNRRPKNSGVQTGGPEASAEAKLVRKVPPYNDEVGIRRTIFALGQMERALRYSQEPTVRARAEYALAQLKNERAISTLISCLRDNESGIRRGAAWALGVIGDVHAVEPLVEATMDPDSEVQACAAEALGSIGDSQAIGPLHLLMYHGDEAVRRAARKALRQIEVREETLKQSVVSQAQQILEIQRQVEMEPGQPETVTLPNGDKPLQPEPVSQSVEQAVPQSQVSIVTQTKVTVQEVEPKATASPVAIVISLDQDALESLEGLEIRGSRSEPIATVIEELIPQIQRNSQMPSEAKRVEEQPALVTTTTVREPKPQQELATQLHEVVPPPVAVKEVERQSVLVTALLSQPVLLQAPAVQQEVAQEKPDATDALIAVSMPKKARKASGTRKPRKKKTDTAGSAATASEAPKPRRTRKKTAQAGQ